MVPSWKTQSRTSHAMSDGDDLAEDDGGDVRPDLNWQRACCKRLHQAWVPGQTQDVDMDLLRVSLTQDKAEAVRANDFDRYATWAETHVRMHVTARLGWWDSGDRISCKWKQRELKATQHQDTHPWSATYPW
jgi:hypothetical protein